MPFVHKKMNDEVTRIEKVHNDHDDAICLWIVISRMWWGQRRK